MQKSMVIIIITLLLVPIASALGISPGRIVFPNMISEGYALEEVLISSASVQEEFVSFELVGPVASWISLNPQESIISVQRGKPYRLQLIAEPPKDIATASYEGSFIIRKLPLGSLGSPVGSFITSELIIPVVIDVTNEESASCDAGGLSVTDSEEGAQLLINFHTQNSGNIRISPHVTVTLFDERGKVRNTHNSVLNELLPSEKKPSHLFFAHTLRPGIYLAEVDVEECVFTKALDFTIYPSGTFSESGTLQTIETKPFVYTHEPFFIEAFFENTGTAAVESTLLVEVKKDGDVVDTLASESVFINAQTQERLEALYVAEEPGEYFVSGIVEFANRETKSTFSKALIVSVSQNPNFDPPTKQPIAPFVVLGILVLIILFLVSRIRKHRRSY